MANKSLTTRQKMVFRVKPGVPKPGQKQVPLAKRKTRILPTTAQRGPKSTP